MLLAGHSRLAPLLPWQCNISLSPVSLQAKELGVRSVIIDGPDSWSQTLQDEGLIENFVGLDFADAETVYERCLTAISDVKQVRGNAFASG